VSHSSATLRDIGQLTPGLTDAALRFGTPAYVIDMVSVAAAARQVESAFAQGWLLHYSLKANDLPAIAGYLASRGWAAAVVSTGEWQCAREAGLRNENVVFEGIGKTDAQLEYAVAETAAGRPIRWLVVESGDELEALARLAASYRLGRDGRPQLDVLLRQNPAVRPETRAEFAVGRATSKFGMPEAEIRRLAGGADLAGGPEGGLRLRGVHVHVGSDLTDVEAWAEAGAGAIRLVNELVRQAPSADTVDFGGGFPLPGPGLPGPAQFRDALVRRLGREALALPRRPAIEPGRYLVGAAGWLVSSVLHARPGPRPQVVLDAGMTELIRPALYGSDHRLHALRASRQAAPTHRETAVEGPICETTDSFGTHPLPPLSRGDLVAFERAGAYAASFTSRYNGRPHPAEILLWPDGALERSHRPGIQELTPRPRSIPAGPGPALAPPPGSATRPLIRTANKEGVTLK
jgi:diaminopimelate decarboxylase